MGDPFEWQKNQEKARRMARIEGGSVLFDGAGRANRRRTRDALGEGGGQLAERWSGGRPASEMGGATAGIGAAPIDFSGGRRSGLDLERHGRSLG
jgi:hypothetical protein